MLAGSQEVAVEGLAESQAEMEHRLTVVLPVLAVAVMAVGKWLHLTDGYTPDRKMTLGC